MDLSFSLVPSMPVAHEYRQNHEKTGEQEAASHGAGGEGLTLSLYSSTA